LWIRGSFLESGEDHGAMIVHGHSIREEGADFQSNRIGIDTGAYRTGVLTALGIEADRCWTLST
jgi:serine/threonine protein phosphatase 1